MKAILMITSFFFAALNLNLQAQNSWVGGTPGQADQWNEARNWSKQHVPDMRDAVVIIPNTESTGNFHPVIREQVATIPCLMIESGARVVVAETGQLRVDGAQTYNYGLLLNGYLENNGLVEIMNTALVPIIYHHEQQLAGDGMLIQPRGIADSF